MMPMSSAYAGNGETLLIGRCAMCHGADAEGSGPLKRRPTSKNDRGCV